MLRLPLPVVLALCLLAGAGCDSADIVSVVADTGIVETSIDAGCEQALPPPRPVAAASLDDPGELTLVFRDWIFLPEGPNNSFDLDGICSTDTASFSCSPKLGDGVLDEIGGVDNSFASQIAPQMRTFTEVLGQDPQAELQREQAKGKFDVMLRIRGWNGLPDDARVEVDFMETVCGLNAEQDDGECDASPAPAWDGTDRFIVSPRSVLAADNTRALVVNDNAYVADGQLVATLPNTLNLTFPLQGSRVYVGFTDARFVVPLPAPGETTVPIAVMTGRWPIGPATETLRFLGDCPDVAGSRLFPLAEIIDRALDIRADPADDHQGFECNAISISFTMTGYRGALGGLGDDVTVPRAACPP